MRKLLVLLVLIVGLAFGGTYGYLRYKVKHTADEFIKTASPFAEISYDGIHATFTGEVGIKRLLIKPRGLADEIRAEALLFQAPDLRFLFFASRELEAGKLPDKLGISVRGAQISMVGPIAEILVAAARQQPQAEPMPLEGCGDRRIGPSELAQMGYTELVTDLHLSYEKESDRAISMHLVSDTREMAASNVDVTLQVDGGLNGHFSQLLGAQPKLSKLRIHYADHGYNRRVSAFCAEALKITPDAFVTQQIDSAQTLLHDQGLAAGDAMITAMRHFFADNGQVELLLAPDQPVNPTELQFYRPAQLIQLLRPQLTVNGTAVELTALAEGARKPRPAVAGAQPQAEGTAASSYTPRYRKIAPTELDKHIGWPVRVRTLAGREIEGTLMSTADGNAVLRRRYASGTMSQPVALIDIREAAVLRQ